MRSTPGMRYAAAALAGLGLATALLGVTWFVNARYPAVGMPYGTAACTGLTPLGWLTPVLIVGVVFGTGWLLVKSDGSHRAPALKADHCACPECGVQMLAEWQMCPYCGHPGSCSGEAGRTSASGRDENVDGTGSTPPAG